MFAEATVPCTETAPKQPLVFASWASEASQEGLRVHVRAGAVKWRRVLMLPGADTGLEKLQHEALQVLQATQGTCQLCYRKT